MIKLSGTVFIIGRHGPWCEDVSNSTIIRCNDHCKNCKTDIRVVGDPTLDLTDFKQEKLVVHAAYNGEEPDHIWVLNTPDHMTHIWLDEGGIINSVPFVPLTGFVAIQFAFFWGAERVVICGMDFFKGVESRGPHYLPPQRAFLDELLETGKVRKFSQDCSRCGQHFVGWHRFFASNLCDVCQEAEAKYL